jgi:hypothetical protein
MTRYKKNIRVFGTLIGADNLIYFFHNGTILLIFIQCVGEEMFRQQLGDKLESSISLDTKKEPLSQEPKITEQSTEPLPALKEAKTAKKYFKDEPIFSSELDSKIYSNEISFVYKKPKHKQDSKRDKKLQVLKSIKRLWAFDPFDLLGQELIQIHNNAAYNEYIGHAFVNMMRHGKPNAQPKVRLVKSSETDDLKIMSSFVNFTLAASKASFFTPTLAEKGKIQGLGHDCMLSWILTDSDRHPNNWGIVNQGTETKPSYVSITIDAAQTFKPDIKYWMLDERDYQHFPNLLDYSYSVDHWYGSYSVAQWYGLSGAFIEQDNRKTFVYKPYEDKLYYNMVTETMARHPSMVHEKNQIMLQFLSLPDQFFQHFVESYIDNTEKIKFFTQWFIQRKQSLRSIEESKDYKDYILSPESKRDLETFVTGLPDFITFSKYPLFDKNSSEYQAYVKKTWNYYDTLSLKLKKMKSLEVAMTLLDEKGQHVLNVNAETNAFIIINLIKEYFSASLKNSPEHLFIKSIYEDISQILTTTQSNNGDWKKALKKTLKTIKEFIFNAEIDAFYNPIGRDFETVCQNYEPGATESLIRTLETGIAKEGRTSTQKASPRILRK